MSKKKFAVYGNCQASALATRLLAHPSFAREFEYVPMKPCFLISSAEIGQWVDTHRAQLDLLVAQQLAPGWREGNAAWDVLSVAQALRPGQPLLRYTDIYFRGVNPVPVYPRTFVRPPHCDYTDLVSLTLAAHGFADAALCTALYVSPTLLDPHELTAIRDLAQLYLQQREADLELRAGADLAALCHGMPAFHTFNHPTNAALDVVARRVLEALELGQETPPAATDEILATVRFPLATSLEQAYAKPVPGAATVRLENGEIVDLRQYFSLALGYLAIYSATQLRQELDAQRLDPISGIVIRAVERALANRLAVSPATVGEIGHLNSQGLTPDFIMSKADPQAIGFMVDLLGMLRGTLLPRLTGSRFSVMDLGAKSGAGSQLLGLLGQSNSFSKVKFDVTCADIDPSYQAYCAARHPNVEYLNADVFQAGRQWDIVICSHVVEHVPDPLEFVRKLRTVATRFIVLAFPYLEDPANLIPGHVNSLGHDFLRSLDPTRYEVYDGLFWSQSLCCIAVLEMGT